MPPPVPLAIPLKLPEPFVIVRVFPPSITLPVPDKLTIDAPLVTPEISNVPLFIRGVVAILPAPERMSVAPLLMIVTP